MTVLPSRLAAWALQQAAALPDTLVTKQVPNPRNWFDVVSGIASIIISLSLVALVIGLLPAAWNFRKSYKKVNELLDRIYGDVNPIMRHASSVADNLNYVTTAVRQDVARLQATVAAANARLDEATRLTERRVREFNALLEVVQGEAEETFVSTAATLRGFRDGAASFRDDALGGLRPDDEFDIAASDDDEDHEDDEDPTPSGRASSGAARTIPSEEAEDERTREAAYAEDEQLEGEQFAGERPRIRRSRRPLEGGGGRPA
jgi:uncharacterized protein YoxC